MPIDPAQLEEVALGSVEFMANPQFAAEELGRVKYEVTPRVEIGELFRDDRGVHSHVKLIAVVKFARVEAEDEGAVPFDMTLELSGKFAWGPGALPPYDDIAKAWLEYNAMYLMWPYLRSHVAMISGMSHLPALTIYTMNVPKPPVIPPSPDVAEAETGGASQESAAPAQQTNAGDSD